MKIAFIVPYLYKWNSYSNVRSHYEWLLQNNYNVTLFNKHEAKESIPYNDFDLIFLHGQGSAPHEYTKIDTPIISFAWSDPNLYYNDAFANNCDIYFTADYNTYKKVSRIKSCYYLQTACNKQFHRDLCLTKETDILVFGTGNHKFVTNRNEIVDGLRRVDFKVKVFGRGWTRHINTYDFIGGQDLITEINKAHLVLDISNETTSLGHRIFESLGCGTPILTARREDIQLHFDENKEILLYNVNRMQFEIPHIIDFYLKHKDKLREIGCNGRIKCHAENNIDNRMNYLINILNSKGYLK